MCLHEMNDKILLTITCNTEGVLLAHTSVSRHQYHMSRREKKKMLKKIKCQY